ncbi:unnamed protein product [Trypanosoma congolense IL3000]|uniref:WGS project CAEQ00000000 data, annotated contig 2344 n=1 Tax=Trypanosoma congolense (strain IL3000) TaxID=1068625 RepID=F9WDB1_TRYCI|nr:unnamed protein product [Trypanosoma congolense IL3000]
MWIGRVSPSPHEAIRKHCPDGHTFVRKRFVDCVRTGAGWCSVTCDLPSHFVSDPFCYRYSHTPFSLSCLECHCALPQLLRIFPFVRLTCSTFSLRNGLTTHNGRLTFVLLTAWVAAFFSDRGPHHLLTFYFRPRVALRAVAVRGNVSAQE